MELSLITYLALLDNSGTLRYTGFYNAMDKITQNKFSAKREQENAQLEQDLFFKEQAFLDDEYLQFLLNICNNILSNKFNILPPSFIHWRYLYFYYTILCKIK